MSEEDFSPLTEFKERLSSSYERGLRPRAQREAEKSYKAPPKTYPKDGKRNSLKATSTA